MCLGSLPATIKCVILMEASVCIPVPHYIETMESFLVSALFAACLALAFGAVIENTVDSSEEVAEWKWGSVKKYLNDSGYWERITDPLKERCAGSSKKFEDAIESVIKCDEAVPDSVTTCNFVRLYGLKCAEPLIKVISDCLPATSKDLPELAVKSTISAFDYICRQDGEHILELANTCIYEFDKQDIKIQACGENVSVKIEGWKKELPTKTQVCNLGKDLSDCLQTHITRACVNEKTRKANLGLVDALLAPCNA